MGDLVQLRAEADRRVAAGEGPGVVRLALDLEGVAHAGRAVCDRTDGAEGVPPVQTAEVVQLPGRLVQRSLDGGGLRRRGRAVDRVVDRQRPAGRGLRHVADGVVEVAHGRRGQVGGGGPGLAPAPRHGAVAVVDVAHALPDAEGGLALRHADQRVERGLVGRVVVRREPALGADRLVDDEGAVTGLRRGQRVARTDPALDGLVGVGDGLRGAGVRHHHGEVPALLRTGGRVRVDHELHRLSHRRVRAQLRGGVHLAEGGLPAVDLHAGDVEALEV